MTTLMLVGATGLVGGAVLRQAQGDVRVSRVFAPTRRLLLPHPKLENPLVDFGASAGRCSVVVRRWRDLHLGYDDPQGGVAGGLPPD